MKSGDRQYTDGRTSSQETGAGGEAYDSSGSAKGEGRGGGGEDPAQEGTGEGGRATPRGKALGGEPGGPRAIVDILRQLRRLGLRVSQVLERKISRNV